MSDFIPEHLMPEILKWLPVKSLARFRCVHRSWNHLITSASFITDHLACSSMKPRLLAVYHSEHLLFEESMATRYFLLDSEMLEFNTKTLLPPFKMLTDSKLLLSHTIVGSANGVICLRNSGIYPAIILLNPLIGKYIPLPRDELPFGHWSCGELLGFRVGEPEDDFRVVRVSYVKVYDEAEDPDILDDYYMVEVCSARDRIWRALDADILESCRILEDKQFPQCLINGVVHWIVGVDDDLDGVEDDLDDGGSTTNTLLLFDFEKEVLGFLALPENLANTYHSDLQVRRIRGMLGVLKYDRTRLGIWAMSEYGNVSSWSCIINVNTPCFLRSFFADRVLGLTEGGQILVFEGDYASAYHDNRLFLYNPANGTRRRLHLEEKIIRIHLPDFVESLIFMDDESGAVSSSAVQFNVVNPGSP